MAATGLSTKRFGPIPGHRHISVTDGSGSPAGRVRGARAALARTVLTDVAHQKAMDSSIQPPEQFGWLPGRFWKLWLDLAFPEG